MGAGESPEGVRVYARSQTRGPGRGPCSGRAGVKAKREKVEREDPAREAGTELRGGAAAAGSRASVGTRRSASGGGRARPQGRAGATGRDREAPRVPPPGSGHSASAERAGAGTEARDWGGGWGGTASTAAVAGRGRVRVRGREGGRGSGRGAAGASVRAAGQPGQRVLPVTAAAAAPDTCGGGGGDPAAGGEMWPLVAALLLGSACCGSAQLLFNKTKSVEFTFCNETVVIPCFVTNMEAQNTTEIYVKWKFKGRDIYTFDGALNRSTVPSGFNSAKIEVSRLLKGDASLKLDKSDATSHTGNYTCEVTELTREGETIVELKYRVGTLGDRWKSCHLTNKERKEIEGIVQVSWFSPNENILIVIFPIFAILLFWGQFGIKTLKYRSGGMDEKTIALLVAGLTITVIVIVGAILFVPGEYSLKNATGLGLIVTSTGILILLHYYVFSTAFGLTSFVIAILAIQVIAYVLAVVGLSLCIAACIPMHGPLLISGLSILALAQLLGLVYMKFVASNQKTIQPPRNN
uniref:Leukocyte surface antigen CD47 n=1 Tax=Callithrix jacchus TaxID=9483 RepID=A0A5F4W4Q4_CALJA